MHSTAPRSKHWSARVSLNLALAATVGGALLLFAHPAPAQVLNPESFKGRESTQGVFVRDSAMAVEKLALAEHMEHLQEWDKAAEVYQDIIKSFADRVVPSQVDGNNEIYQYSSVTPFVQERLAKWPPEALRVYREKYENEAAALLESAHDDPVQLHRILTLYFVTDAAKQASMRLMDLNFERGEFSAVTWVANKLLDWHPFLTDERPAILFRAALASHLAGNEEAAQSRLKELSGKFPQAAAMVRGAEANLSQSLSTELTGDHNILREFAADSWPMLNGSLDRSRVPKISTYGGAKLFSVEVEKPSLRNVPPTQRGRLLEDYREDLGGGFVTGIFPVVDRGEMFFQDNANVYAVSAESGYPLPGWVETYPGDKNGRYSINAWSTPRTNQSTLTVTDNSVLAVMGQLDLVAMQSGGSVIRDTRLVCLDRRTGAERWVAMPRKFPDNQASLRNLDLSGSPLVVGDTVYVQARGGKGLQFEDSYVMAFDLASGQLNWTCYVASANSGAQTWDMTQGAILAQNNSHLAYANGRLYALTNVGAVAAIDAYDGTIAWLNIYQRKPLEANYNPRGFGGRNVNIQRLSLASVAKSPWMYNPVIASGGNVFVLPSDSQNVIIYDAGSGAQVKQISTRKLDDMEEADVLLGVVDDRLILNSNHRVFGIRWPGYDDKKSPLENSAAGNYWASSKLQNEGQSDNSILGRGFVTADSVLVPTTRKLYRLSMQGGKILQTYPAGDADGWSDEEGPGNVLATDDRIVIAAPTRSGPMRVSVYTDLSLATAKLEAEVAAAPRDPAQRLRYADVLFAAGKVDAAIGKLDEAIGLLNDPQARETDARSRIFNSAMTYAQKLAKENNPQMADTVAALYDRAGAAANNVSQKVNFRLARAAYARTHNHRDVEVRFMQQILLDESLRTVPVSDADGNTIFASELARQSIDRAITAAGAGVYAPFEKAADDALLNAARIKNADQLQRVASDYPNSASAPRALVLAADAFESASSPRQALNMLLQAYFHYPNTPEQTRIFESMARNYARMPHSLDVAVARLAQAGNSPEGNRLKLIRPIILPDGRKIENMSLADAAVQLRQFNTQQQALNLPDIALPPTPANRGPGNNVVAFKPEDPNTVISGVNKLVVPDREFARNDRIITYTDGVGVRVYPVGKNTPVLNSNAVQRVPRGAAWNDLNLAVWSDNEIALLSPDAGKAVWSVALKSIPEIEVVAQPGSDEGQNNPDNAAPQNVVIGPRAAMPRNMQQFVGRGGQVQIAVNNFIQPMAAPVVRPANEEIVRARPTTDALLVATSDGRVIALSQTDGKVLWQQRPSDRAITQLLATDDFVVIRLADENGTDSQLAVYETNTGQVIARRSFNGDSGDSSVLINAALSPDGTLVYMTSNSLFGKNLFELGGFEKPTFRYGARPGDAAPNYMASSTPEYLQIAGDKIIAVSALGASASVRVLSLQDGSPLKIGDKDALLLDQSSSMRFVLRCVGSTLYIATAKEVRKMDIEKGTAWSLAQNTRTNMSIHDMVVTRGHLVVLNVPARSQFRDASDLPTASLLLGAYSRADDGRGLESGLLEHQIDLAQGKNANQGNITISGWQIVDGGIYYWTNMQVHFLQGARP